MSLNKKILAIAILGGLAGTAQAQVVLDDDANTNPARTYASELTKPAILTDGADDIVADLNYNFSGGEVRYGRVKCTSNIDIEAPTVTSSDPALISVGSVNGAGTEALFFSLTASAAPTATENVLLTVDANNELQDNNAVSCSFSLYDQPSQAQDGGTFGQIYVSETEEVIASSTAINFSATPGLATADVEAAGGAYFDFVGVDNNYGAVTLAQVAGVLDAAGAQATVFGIIDAAATSIVVTGDYSAAAAGTSFNGVAADALTANSATFDVAAEVTNGALLYVETGAAAIQTSSYIASLDTTALAGFTLGSIADVSAGEIDRNGTELQAPLVQRPAGYLSRVALTNTGSVDRTYTISVFGEAGAVISTGNLSGTVEANSLKIIDVNDVIADSTGKDRATLVLNVAAPNNQIQAVYQIVDVNNGGISNETMVRPGTN